MKKIFLSDLQRDNLRKIRKEADVIADELSELIGKSKGWYSQIENGRLKKISMDDLKLISHQLSCSIKDILGYDPDTIENISDYNYDGKSIIEIIAENVELKLENRVLKERLELILKISSQ